MKGTQTREKSRRIRTAGNRRSAAGIRVLAVIATAVLLLSLLPIFLVAPYNRPAADDFRYGATTHAVYRETGSIGQVIAAAAGEAAETYHNWQGSFSAIFFMALQPAVFDTALYALVPFIMIFTLAAGIGVFCHALLGRVFGASPACWLLIAAFLTLYSVQLAPSAVEGFFWYNGALYYTFYHALVLLTLGFLLYFATATPARGCFLLLCACLLSTVTGSGNYMSAITLVLAELILIFLLYLQKNRAWRAALIPLAIHLICLLVSVAAPGNAVRQSDFSGHPSIFIAGFLAFKKAFYLINAWCDLPFLLSLLLLIPAFWSIAGGNRFRYPLPLLATATSLCLFAAALYAPIYAMGDLGGGRLHNAAYFLLLLLAVGNAFYWVGWLRRHLDAAAHDGASLGDTVRDWVCRRALPLLALVLLLFGMATLGAENHKRFTAYVSLKSLLSGDAARYAQEIDARAAILESAEPADVLLAPLRVYPAPLFFDDITVYPDDWRNKAVAEFYEQKSVALQKDSPL